MKKLILIKLGGSVITDKSKQFVAKDLNIKKLAKEIKKASETSKIKIIIGHGAGSFGHIPAHKYQTKSGLINKDSLLGMSITEDAARQLNMIVVKNCLTQNLPVFSFSPASFLFTDIQSLLTIYLDPIKSALEIGSTPIVYGDVVMDRKQGCTIFSTEKVLGALASKLRKDYKMRMIFVTDVDGVYGKDGKTVRKITPENFWNLKVSITGAKNVDVTGGMIHKVEEALSLAKKYGIETSIINGNRRNELTKAILGSPTNGTKIQGP